MHVVGMTVIAGVVAIAANAQHDSGKNILDNGDFSQGMKNWTYRPGDDSMTSLATDSGTEGEALVLQPDGKTLGVNSAPLVLGSDIAPDGCYDVQAAIKSEGLQEGIFAFSICCYDQTGKRIRQMSVYNLSSASKPHDWMIKKTQMGPGTANPLPPETHSVRIRFSFWEKTGKCRAKVWVDAVAVTRRKPGKFAHWPGSVLVTCGPLQTRFESRSFWTLYRLDYKGTRLGKDQFGSHYGTVANFKGLGFVGSGHTENAQTEQVKTLQLIVDGTPVEKPEKHYDCTQATLVKEATIRDIALHTRLDVHADRIVETVTMKSASDDILNLLYHFMHPWVTEMSHYLALTEDGQTVRGEFVGDKGMKISKPVQWSAVYSKSLKMGAVTVVLEKPEGIRWDTRYWDVPDRYRKHYFTTCFNRAVPQGRDLRYRVVVLPFEAPPEAWEDKAAGKARLARDTHTQTGEPLKQ